MELDSLHPRYVELLHNHVLIRSIIEYRQALAVLQRNRLVHAEDLQTRLLSVLSQLEQELERRGVEI